MNDRSEMTREHLLEDIAGALGGQLRNVILACDSVSPYAFAPEEHDRIVEARKFLSLIDGVRAQAAEAAKRRS